MHTFWDGINPTIVILLLGACFLKESPKSYSKGLRDVFFCRFKVYRTAIKSEEVARFLKMLARRVTSPPA